MSLKIQHQLSNQTRMDRFPKLFSTVRKIRPKPLRILSFGCSTGEECATLNKYFPDSEIVGVDIVNWCIQRAMATNPNPQKIAFVDELTASAGKFDIVFCLMVFFSIYNTYQEENFQKTLESLDRFINPNGILVIYTSTFDFMTQPVAKHYMPIRQWKRIHDRDGKSYFCGYYIKDGPSKK